MSLKRIYTGGLRVVLDNRFYRVFLSLCLVAALCGVLHAEAAPPALTTNSQDSDLPPYEFQYNNALYATIGGFLGVKDQDVKNMHTFKLSVESFRKKFPVRAVIQNEAAPLIVILVGLGSHADGSVTKLWTSWYADAGYSVLTFDSPFTPGYVDLSASGVSGNPVAEAEGTKNIISAFLEQTEIKGRVTKIGVVGMSYGGIQALLLGQMANENKLPFKLEGLQSYSAPINMYKTLGILDQWYSEDRWKYTLAELKHAFSGNQPVGPDQPVPYSDSLMRAGIAADFRLGLSEIILKNNDIFKLNVLPNGSNLDDEYVKQDYAEAISFSRFLTDVSFPYWRRRMNLQSINEFTSPVELNNLMPKQPAFTEVILAEDDPFNTPEDAASFKVRWVGHGATVLPRGGHLGFIGDKWTKAKLLSIFKIPPPASQSNVTAEAPK